MENVAPNMSKQTMHQALSEYVSKRIMKNGAEFSREEWVRMMNSYSAQEPIEKCAEKLGLSYEEVRNIYYAFTMYVVEYAMEHIH